MKGDQKALEKGSEILKWAEKMSKGIGLWPLTTNYYLFSICTFYYSFYVMLALIDLYNSADDTEKLVDNVTQSMSIVLVYIRMLLLRINIYSLGEIFTQVFKDFNISTFESSYEIEIFMEFIKKGTYLLRGFVTFMLSTEIIWYLSSLTAPPEVLIDDNNQTTFIIPYNLYIFYEINSLTRYYLTFLFLLPTVWVFGFGYMSVDCILISLVFYICGKMAVLTIKIDALENSPDCRKELHRIIVEHSKLLKMGDGVKDAYSAGLLVYLINTNFIICIVGYQMLISFMVGQEADLLRYTFYMMQMYILLSIYCMISEHLTSESLKCCEAFYNCTWYDFSIDCSKDIMFCIERSQQPLALWAGKFTMFSSDTLTNVTKNAVGYWSVLRNFMINK